MSLVLLQDNKMAAGAEALAPHKNILDPNQPRSLTNVATMPKPVASTISCWMSHATSDVSNDPVKRAFMESLAD